MIEFSTCVHEAGHALALYLLGGTIKTIEVNGPWGDSANFCKHPGIFKDSIGIDHPMTKSAVLALLAGPAAEFRFGQIDIRCGLHDFKLARACLTQKGWVDDGLDDSAFYQKFCGDAEQFVNHPIRWKIIGNLAKELQTRRRMAGQEVVGFLINEANKLPAVQQLELYFPDDGLGGDQLSVEEHGG